MTSPLTSATSSTVALALMRPTAAPTFVPTTSASPASRGEPRQDQVTLSAEAKRLVALAKAQDKDQTVSLDARGAGSSEAAHGRLIQSRIKRLFGEGAAPAAEQKQAALAQTSASPAAEQEQAARTSAVPAAAQTQAAPAQTSTAPTAEQTRATTDSTAASPASAAEQTQAASIPSSATPSSAPSNDGATSAPGTSSSNAAPAAASSNAASNGAGNGKKNDKETVAGNGSRLGQTKQAERGKTVSIIT